MQRDPSFGPAGGIQRLFWLIPTAFLLGASDSDVPTAACAAALVGVAWQGATGAGWPAGSPPFSPLSGRVRC